MPRLPKGSDQAKERMAHLRSLRKKKLGGSIEPVTPMTVAEPPIKRTRSGDKWQRCEEDGLG